MRLCNCFHLVSWGSNRQRLSCSDPPLSWASRAAILGADYVRLGVQPAHNMDPQIWSSSSKAGSLSLESCWQKSICQMYSTVPKPSAHTAQQKTSHTPASSIAAYSPFISQGNYLAHQEIFQRKARIPVPGEDRIGPSERHAPTLCAKEILQMRFVGAANYFPQGGLKMWGMSELLYLRALQPRALRRRRERGQRERQKGQAAWRGRVGGGERAWRSHLEDLHW